ncbi:Protein-disulfide isomerase [Flavobacterium resistens]|uniref:Protein-disulfide isomerase n=1 Tax=Flavobacterium resistens TaxID=443612 RepID=A0A521D9G9_9FLAO|nr:cysteine peptidase family C39 domain-containing protein [Flavobacterium resistens]MRX70408.1 hypothetical protein [Flavobacterium resistens]SMO68242.1 Protein-disulfide isomerase [Flavobacterium resistens]
MNKEFYNIYEYLEKEGFYIDLNEFDLQIQVHPAYPSLLSITDTLSFFNVNNGAFHIDSSRIDSLPNRFMAILRDENYERRYCIIEVKNENYICYNGKSKVKISKKELESQWSGVVILIENPELETGNVLKKILIKIRDKQSKENKNTHNYQAFKETLLSFNILENNLPQSSTIQLGNIDASLKIIMVINPFSNFCKESYFILEEILQKNFDKVGLDIRFNFNNNDYSYKKSKIIHQQLVAFYLENGQEFFMKELHNWFENKDEKKLCATPISPLNEIKINEILNAQFNSNSENNIIFTPTIVINKYIFPKQIDLKELSYFLSEISEDKDFQEYEMK